MNILQNVFNKNNNQPWKQYYQGIKPQNPLGGNIIRRMGNKVKPVISSVVGGKQMTFSYLNIKEDLNPKVATFRTQPPGYIPPYVPLNNQQSEQSTQPSLPIYNPAYGYSPTAAANVEPLLPPGMTMEDYKAYLKAKREQERTHRETKREARREISDARATYRTFLDTAREGRNWLTIGR